MGEGTGISWTDNTFNPWMGCTRISPGCKYCYAVTLTKNRMGLDLWGNDKTRQRTKSTWANVRKWNRKAKKEGRTQLVFIGSLMDVFEDRPELHDMRQDMWDLIWECDALTFQLLTKRPENMSRMMPDGMWFDTKYGPWRNVWLGVTVESQECIGRIDVLRQMPAVCRFVSYEPAIGPLDLSNGVLDGIDWVIYGGESDGRPDDTQWARDVMAQCREAEVAFFYKQASGHGRANTRDKLDGKRYHAFPTVK